MQKPILHAVLAELYIACIVTGIFYGPKLVGDVESIIVPIAMLSLLVLSVAVMSYLFGYMPLTLYIDGKKQEAFRFFFSTVLAFAAITALAFTALLAYGLLR